MKIFFLRILPLFFCTFALITSGCSRQDEPSSEVNALNQTSEIQKSLSVEAQVALDVLTGAQQIPQAIEALHTKHAENTASGGR